MDRIVKLFKNGGSQAVRLPRECRFRGDRVRMRRVGNSVLLEPFYGNAKDWFAALDRIPADPDFLRERNQPETPVRGIFD